MARLAIFIDGGYAAKIAENHLRFRIDYAKLSNAIRDVISEGSAEPLDLLRTYFYDCLPYQSERPTPEEATRFSRKRSFFAVLQRLPKYNVREGRLRHRGQDANGVPIFQQKRVDLMIGLDVAGHAFCPSSVNRWVIAGPAVRKRCTLEAHSTIPAWYVARRSALRLYACPPTVNEPSTVARLPDGRKDVLSVGCTSGL